MCITIRLGFFEVLVVKVFIISAVYAADVKCAQLNSLLRYSVIGVLVAPNGPNYSFPSAITTLVKI